MNSRLPGSHHPAPSLPRGLESQNQLRAGKKKTPKVTDKDLFLNFHMILFTYILIPRAL